MKRLLRSVLFVPGDRLSALQKAKMLPTDYIIIDLEDAVPPTSKAVARESVKSFLESWQAPRSTGVVVRVNCPLTTEWGAADLSSIRKLDIDGFLLPKVSDERVINSALDILTTSKSASRDTNIWAMIETARGVINVNDIAQHENVKTLVFGSNDLTKDINALHTPNREPMLYSMSRVVLAARAFGKSAIDGVHLNIKDETGLVMACVQSRSMGFDGKSLIHPNQIATTNRCFSPSEEEVAYAHTVIKAYEEAMKSAKGVCVVDGKLIELLHVEQARNILKTAEAAGIKTK